MRLAIGGLIRDRLPQLKVYLTHLRLVEWPGEAVAHRMPQEETETAGVSLAPPQAQNPATAIVRAYGPAWLFVLDNCQPEIEARVLEVFPEATVVRVNDKAPAYNRDGRRAYAHMADLRNRFAQEALKLGVDGLLSVDSDIVATPDLAARLIEVDRPWVAALVDNSRGARVAYNVMWRTGKNFCRRALDRVHGGPADLIGAVCFYRRDLLERVAFSGKGMSEDTGFSLAAAEAGFRGWYIPLELEHLMTDTQTAAHLRRCGICAKEEA